MRHESPENCIQLLNRLAESDGDPTDQALPYFDHEDAAVREAAVWALWNGRLDQMADPLVHRIEHDSDTLVQSAAVSVLGRYVYEGLMLSDEERDSPLGEKIRIVNAYLRSIFDDTNRSELLRRRALESLSFNADKDIEAAIKSWITSDNDLYRKSAAFAMGRASARKFSEYLIAALDDESPRVRTEAIRSIGEQGIRKSVPKLIAVANGDNQELALEAIQALGQVGGTRAESALKVLSRSKDPERAETAREVLDELSGY